MTRDRRAALVAILIVAFNLRIGVVSVAPLLDDIRSTYGMSHALAGATTAIPSLAFAFFTIPGARWTMRLGVRRVLALATLALAAALVARAAAPTAATFLGLTAPIGISLAVCGAILPMLVKEGFRESAGTVTGFYVAALDLGAGASAMAAVPLSGLFGGWRPALASTAIPAIVAAALVTSLRETRAARPPDPGGRAARAGSSLSTSVLLVAVFAAQSACFTGLVTWVASAYRAAGSSAEAAGAAASVILLAAIPAAFAIPLLSDRFDRRRALIPVAFMTAVGAAGTALWPTSGSYLWLALFGAGSGGLFPLALTFPLDVARDPAEAGRLAAVAIAGGYALSSVAPMVVGVLHDASGGYRMPFLLLAGCAAATAPLALALPQRDRTG